MKRIFLIMAVVAISFPSFGRVICDTTCHASGKMVGRSNTHFTMRSLPSGVYLVYVAGFKGVACKVVKN